MQMGKTHVLSGKPIIVNNYSILSFHSILSKHFQIVTSLLHAGIAAKVINDNEPQWKNEESYVDSVKQILLYVEFFAFPEKKTTLKIQSNLADFATVFFFHRNTISWFSIRDFVKINKLSRIAVKLLQTVQNHDIIYKHKKRYRWCRKHNISGFIPGRKKGARLNDY